MSDNRAAQWLTGEFALWGIHFQNWMLLAGAIVVLGILYHLRAKRP